MVEVSMEEKDRYMRLALYLAVFTIVYNVVEGVVALAFGGDDESLSLMGFGLDSFVEVFSAGVVLWRFRSDVKAHYRKTRKTRSSDKLINDQDSEMNPVMDKAAQLLLEKRATHIIGVLLVMLAVVAWAGAIAQLATGHHPDTTIAGVFVSCISLSFMFFLWYFKTKMALILDSATLMKDAACSLGCIQLSIVLFLGSLVFELAPSLWWVDAVTTLIIGGFIMQEGVEAVKASRKEDFQGGCGCCSADDSALFRLMKKRVERDLQATSNMKRAPSQDAELLSDAELNGRGNKRSGDTPSQGAGCCSSGGCGDAKKSCGTAKMDQATDCCSGGSCTKTVDDAAPVKQDSGADVNVTIAPSSCCSSGSCGKTAVPEKASGCCSADSCGKSNVPEVGKDVALDVDQEDDVESNCDGYCCGSEDEEEVVEETGGTQAAASDKCCDGAECQSN